MKFVLASNNKKKIGELRRILTELSPKAEICSLSDIGFTDEIIEDGETFAENAMIKARAAAALGYIGIADDSGICVDKLGGKPGIYSARYSGYTKADGVDVDEENNKKLLSSLGDTPREERGAHYACALACVFPESMKLPPIEAYGECYGTIIFDGEQRGEGGFGYDPLFLSADYNGKTMAELSADEKDKISHRGKALREFAEKIKPIIEKGLI